MSRNNDKKANKKTNNFLHLSIHSYSIPSDRDLLATPLPIHKTEVVQEGVHQLRVLEQERKRLGVVGGRQRTSVCGTA